MSLSSASPGNVSFANAVMIFGCGQSPSSTALKLYDLFPVIDHLSYSYFSNSNKLQAVTDTANHFDSRLGDFKYDPAGKTATDYDYDVNASITKDRTKYIDDIQYNHLNLPKYISYYPPGAVSGGGFSTRPKAF